MKKIATLYVLFRLYSEGGKMTSLRSGVRML